jgi:hypothetical protein
MKTLLRKLLLQFSLLLPLMGWAEERVATFQSSPINIDGKMTEWGINPRYFNSESNLLYELRNDSSQVYIILKTNEPGTIMQMLRAGFTLKLTTKTNPPLISTISFAGMKKGDYRQLNSDKLVEKTDMQKYAGDSVLIDGFISTEKVVHARSTDLTKISFAKSRRNPEELIFEFRIPIREMYGNGYLLSNCMKSPINLRIILNDLSQGRSSVHSQMGGMNSHRSGGMGGNRMGGGMRNNSMGGGGYPGMGGDLNEEAPENMHSENNGQGGMNFTKKAFSAEFVLSTGN